MLQYLQDMYVYGMFMLAVSALFAGEIRVFRKSEIQNEVRDQWICFIMKFCV